MIVNLSAYCGLDIKLDFEKARLIFGEGLNSSQPGVRSLEEMKEVLLDKNITEPKELYDMHRDVYCLGDKPLLEKNKLRYDVTLIKPDPLGRELMKTAGHYHPQDFGELYEVVYGHC
jgi:glucose-6-phosphate isomerase